MVEIRAIRAAVDERTAALQAAFDEKAAKDHHKEALIDKLHAELQEHRKNLVSQAVRPLKVAMIRLHDDLGKTVEHYRAKGLAELTPERALELLASFQTQVEIALDEGGVATFREEGDRFESRRQKALRTVPTRDPAQVGTVAARLRPGFEEGTMVHEKERVAVYVLAPPEAPEAIVSAAAKEAST